MEFVTRETVAEKFASYLHHDLSLTDLVAWAEWALMESEFDPAHFATIRDAVVRLGAADIRTFGLAWEDCKQLLAQLGYSAQVNIVAR